MSSLPDHRYNKVREKGFTLLEILVAFVVLALSLTVIFQIFSRGTRNLSLANDYNRAIIVAQNQLARLNGVDKIEPGESSGVTEDGIRWHRVITEYEETENDGFHQNYPLVNVEITTQWKTLGKDYHFSLKTRRIAGMD